MNTKIFSVARLTVGDQDFTLQGFSSINPEYNDEQGEQNRIIQTKIFNENRFISLYFEEGNVFPRSDIVHNKKTKDEAKQKREFFVWDNLLLPRIREWRRGEPSSF